MNIDLGLIINQIIDNFDFAFMIVVNVLTYIMIKIYEFGKRKSSKLTKRIFLLIAIALIGGIYLLTGEQSKVILLNSAILAPVFYSWILKPILDKVGLGYIDLDLN